MADSQIASLFATPEMYQQAQNAQALERANAFAQLDPLQRAAQSMYYGGYQAGNAIAGALGGQDPMLQQISAVQSVLKQVNPSDPRSLLQAAQQLQGVAPQQAMELAKRAQELQKETLANLKTGSEIDKNMREKLTNEQRNYAQAKDEGYKGTFNDWLVQKAKAGATNVSLSTSADKSYGSELGNLVAKSDIALRDSAQAAPDTLNSIQQTRSLLDSGKVFTGTGANAKLNVLALGQAFGVTGADDNEIIAKTQQLQQQRSKAVLGQIKASGLGTGQGFTDKDLNFLERASAGNISLSADTIREQLNIEEKLAKASVNKWNARVKSLPSQLTSSMGLNSVELPTTPYKPASGIPTNGLTGNSLVDKYLVNPQGQQ